MLRFPTNAAPILAAFLLAVPALAGATTDVQGDWQGPAVAKVRIRGVGAAAARSTDFVTVGDGTWSAHNSEGYDYAGSWSAAGRSLSWNYDTASRGELELMLDDWAAAEGFPDADTAVSSVKTKAKARQTRRGKKLKVKSIVQFDAFIAGRQRVGKFKGTTTFSPD